MVNKIKELEPLSRKNTGSLTEKQKRFCMLYAKSLNGQDSYMKVYHVKSNEVAAVNASRLLSNANVKLYIERLNKNIEETLGISKLKVVNEHAKIAFSSIAYMHDSWVERKKLDNLTEEEKACIQEISTKIIEINSTDKEPTKEVVYVKVKLYDKQKSLEDISKLLGYDEPSKMDLQVKAPIISFGEDDDEPEQEI